MKIEYENIIRNSIIKCDFLNNIRNNALHKNAIERNSCPLLNDHPA
jgi:hypothetical protein